MKNYCKVFLADDDQDEAILFNDIIVQHNMPFNIQHCRSLAELNEHLKKGDVPDGIVLTIVPRLRGWDAWLKEFKSDTRFAKIPVVLSTDMKEFETEHAQAFPGVFKFRRPTTAQGFIEILDVIKNGTQHGSLKKAKRMLQE